MAFLDRIVSDLIKQSTGVNARSFVRAVGGKNMILLGGAAVAGALAIDKMNQAKNAPATSSSSPPPPLPPLPQQGAPTPQELPPLPPPMPPPQELVYAIVRTMVAAALADGEMHAAEKQLIEKRLGESGLSNEQIAQIRKDLVFPAAPEELSRLVADADDKETLYRFGALIVLADDDVADGEKTWLDGLAAELGLEAGRRREIDKDLFEPT